ncbi:DNA-binding winged helix-turn-helix (wHTH) protein [Alteromonadaceae bacterium 2753L.S.0a.02]|nr:DNA-binding winged helix-turn-helix (wHTH) protein [Alteromonadaceae bacterium 2753L.S.0a.02]
MPAADNDQNTLVFASFQLEESRRQLFHQSNKLEVSDRVFDFLALLLRNPGELVDKDTLLEQLWPGQFVSEASLSRLVSDTRQLLASCDADNDFIHTVRGKGFRFNPAIAICRENTVPSESVAVSEKHWRYFAVASLGLLLATLLLWQPWHTRNPAEVFAGHGQKVLVLPVHVRTGDDQDSWVEYGVMTMLARQLQAYRDLTLIDPKSVISGLAQIGFQHSQNNAEKFQQVCGALGCDVLLVAQLQVEDGNPVLEYSLYRDKTRSPSYRFVNEDIFQAAQMLTEHALSQLVPSSKQRLELKPFYSDDATANQNFAFGVSALYHTDYPAAEAYLKLALERKENFHWASAYMAHTLYALGELQQSKALVDKLEQQVLNDRLRLFLGNLRSNLAYVDGELQASQAISLELIPLAKKLGDYEMLGNLLMNTGSTWTALGDSGKAQDYLRQALSVYKEHHYPLREAQALFNLGNALHISSENSPEVIDLYQEAAALFRQFNATAYQAYAMAGMGEFKRNAGRFEESRQLFTQVAELYREVGDEEGMLLTETELAELALKQGELKVAEQHALLAYEGAGSTFTFARSHASAMLSQIYLNSNQPEKVPALIEERQRYEWFDPRPPAAMIPASYQHLTGNLQEAVDLALAVKQKLGEAEWNESHQKYLDLFEQSLARKQVIAMDYFNGSAK